MFSIRCLAPLRTAVTRPVVSRATSFVGTTQFRSIHHDHPHPPPPPPPPPHHHHHHHHHGPGPRHDRQHEIKKRLKEWKKTIEEKQKELQERKKDWTWPNVACKKQPGGFDFSFGFGLPSIEPAMDVKDTPEEILIHLEVPGVSKNDLSVELHDGEIVISGKRESTQEAKEGDEEHGYVVKERRWSYFSRAVAVPQECKVGDVTSKLVDGVLHVGVKKPKPEAAKTGQKINIE